MFSKVVGIITDLLLLPVALVLLFLHYFGFLKDKKYLTNNKVPVLLLHGSGFNSSEFILAKYILKDENVFTLSFDDGKGGIDDFAKGEIKEFCLHIKKVTNQNNLIIIGHSMGGFIASEYAENYADGINVLKSESDPRSSEAFRNSEGILKTRRVPKFPLEILKIITIATPWQGAWILDLLHKFNLKKEKRYTQMCCNSSFRKRVLEQSLNTKIKYYSIYSEDDPFVSGESGRLNENSLKLNYVGHYGIIALPFVWKKVKEWINES